MQLPLSSKVVVIDDHIEEAFPLIQALSLKGVASVYFSGDNDQLPKNPFDGVRVVFLDLELADTKGAKPKNKASKAVGVLKKLIVPNSKYILIAWTKHPDDITYLDVYLDAAKIKPVINIIDLDKSDCYELVSGEKIFILEKIEEKISEKLKDFGVIKLFFAWENLITKSSEMVFSAFTSLVTERATWDTEMSKVMFDLAESYAGKQFDKTKTEEIAKNSLLTFNSVFLETIERAINEESFTSTGLEQTGGNTTDKIKAEINTKLFLLPDTKKVRPGNVYQKRMTPVKLKKFISKKDAEYVNAGKEDEFVSAGGVAVFVEMSPACDYSQDKWEVHRVIEGVLVPCSDCKFLKKADYLYREMPHFMWKNKIMHLVFNKRQLKSEEKGRLPEKDLKFTINMTHLVALQHSVAGHISRPGTVSLRKTVV